MKPNARSLFFLGGCLVVGALFPQASWGQQATEYGVGVRFRGLFVPKIIFEQFVNVAPVGITQPGLGVAALQRRGNFEAALGVGWAPLNADDGVWHVDTDRHPSLVEFDSFSWITLDVTAVWRWRFERQVALRYGIGVGIAFLRGDILETDYQCQGNRIDLDSCMQRPDATDVRRPIDLPPVVPVVNALVGIQYTPSEQVAFNLDAGLHTTFFVGVSVAIFFSE